MREYTKQRAPYISTRISFVLSGILVLCTALTAAHGNIYQGEIESTVKHTDLSKQPSFSGNPIKHFFHTIHSQRNVPAGTPVIELSPQETPLLYTLVDTNKSQLNFPAEAEITLFYAPDTVNIDAQFAVYNQKAGILLHAGTFEHLKQSQFESYIGQVMGRIKAMFIDRYQKAVADKWKLFGGVAGAGGFLTILVPLINALIRKQKWGGYDPNSTAVKLGLPALSAGFAALLTYLGQRNVTHSGVGNVITYHEENPRDYPSTTDRKSPIKYNAPPEYILTALLRHKDYIKEQQERLYQAYSESVYGDEPEEEQQYAE